MFSEAIYWRETKGMVCVKIAWKFKIIKNFNHVYSSGTRKQIAKIVQKYNNKNKWNSELYHTFSSAKTVYY